MFSSNISGTRICLIYLFLLFSGARRKTILCHFKLTEKQEWYKEMCLVTQLYLTFCDPMDCSPPGFSVHGDSPGRSTGVDCHALPPGDLPNPEIEPRSPTLQASPLLSELPGKPIRKLPVPFYQVHQLFTFCHLYHPVFRYKIFELLASASINDFLTPTFL